MSETLGMTHRWNDAGILSIVFDRPEPLVDGNVQRVLARWDAREDPTHTTESRRWTWDCFRAARLAWTTCLSAALW